MSYTKDCREGGYGHDECSRETEDGLCSCDCHPIWTLRERAILREMIREREETEFEKDLEAWRDRD